VSETGSPSAVAIREELVRLVCGDLLGPAGGPHEEVTEGRVRERYLTGMLAPRRVGIAPEEQDELAAGGADSPEEGSAEPGTVQTYTMFPSALGMTFAVDADAVGLLVTARWGRYLREVREVAEDAPARTPKRVWQRYPMEGRATLQPLAAGRIGPLILDAEQHEVTLQGSVRRNNDHWIVTLFLVNGQEEPKKGKDQAWVFQPELIAEAADGAAIFCRKLTRDPSFSRLDPRTREELESVEMLYRRHVEFAVGHHTAVHTDAAAGNPNRAVRIGTRTIPFSEVARQTPPTVADNADLEGLVLDMKRLAEMPVDELVGNLGILATAYELWIGRREQEIGAGAAGLGQHRVAAGKALTQCRVVLGRIREGIELFGSDAKALEAFRFANQAMALQRVRTLFSREVRKGRLAGEADLPGLDVPANRSWYPFQLAFVLLNLPALTRLDHRDRSAGTEAVADLLWFPTGGGKTEAYLGLTAYTLAMRRLQGEVEGRSGEHGVAVLMRYTLRLLTLQQFQRATTLICACETLRRADVATWGAPPFRIGLWVGMKATPNTTEQAEEAIAQSHGARPGGNIGTPAQLTSCPWCGSPIRPGRDIKVYKAPGDIGRTVISCGDPLGLCPFTERQSPKEGIPALVVDEEIYRQPPALLIATVDKFAQMPWRGPVQMLFGQVNGLCPRHGFRSPEIEDADSHPARKGRPGVRTVPHAPLRPPDLIIQDELHLISGPLGSLVGLYETAVDELSSWDVGGKRIRPKVIASTATVRRASEQVRKLFCRSLEVFPQHGTDIGDNFFSLQREPDEEQPGRLYLGICAPGRRLPQAALRVYIALLAAGQKLYECYDTAADPWMTLVGYFNSIRELGGMRRVVDDDVRTRLRDTASRGLANRMIFGLEELTSRRTGTEIPRILDRLDVVFNKADDARRQAQRRNQQNIDLPHPFDVVLATNMISVGVDVDRLGLMVVAGQPKTTAEYIQATSRVGRKFPGLVVTLYNWARPRDLSHYETFEHYHTTFYQHVEALSVTPFAARALDRGLTGVLVSLVRLMADELNANPKAAAVTRNHPLLGDAIERIVRRAGLVEAGNTVADDVRRMLADRRDLWLKSIEQAQSYHLGYRDSKDGVTRGLLRPAEVGGWEKFTCLNSLRDVEPTVSLLLTDPVARTSGSAQGEQGPDEAAES